jgi:CDP-glucose 4,6-dehydratase
MPLVRSPNSVRPWQHVLEALGGYLMIAERLLAGERCFADGWNFGPSEDDAKPVSWIVERMRATWGGAADVARHDARAQPHEAALLRLDCSKARAALGWRPVLSLDQALDWIVDWHSQVTAGGDARVVSLDQLDRYAAAFNATRRVAA